MRKCSVKDCDNKHVARGYCRKHYIAHYREGIADLTPRREKCEVKDCNRKHYSKGYCSLHYQRVKKYGSIDVPVREKETKPTCLAENCKRESEVKGYCSKHYNQMLLFGETRERTREDPNEYIFNGDGTVSIIMYDNSCEESGRCIISEESVGIAKKYKWSINKRGYGGGYVTANVKGKNYALHRLVVEATKGDLVDHINHDTLDNRLINLRICNYSENSMNRIRSSNNSSGVKGVYFDKGRGKYVASIGVNRKSIFLGAFEKLEDATKARQDAEIKYHGEFRYLGN